MDTCYEIFLDIKVSEKQFTELLDMARQYHHNTSIERAAPYVNGYTEIVFEDYYERGEVDEQDGNEQVGTAKIDKVIFNEEARNIIYRSAI